MVGRFLLYLAVFTASYAVKAELYVFPAPSPEATTHTLNTEITLYEEQTLSAIEQKNIDLLIKDTYQTLDKSNTTSALSEINRRFEGTLPAWLYSAIKRCEAWFNRTEGNISCRNGELYDYWEEYIQSKHDLSRSEVRRLARVARIAEVNFNDDNSVAFASPIQWDLSEFAASLAVERIANYLISLNIRSYHISAQELETHASNQGFSWQGTVAQEAVTQTSRTTDAVSNPSTIAYIRPWQRPVLSTSKLASLEKGVLSHSDGWPSAKFQAISVADNAFEAMLLAHFSATKTAQQAMELVNANPSLALKLIDENGRVFTSNTYTARTSGDSSGKNKAEKNGHAISIDITLPLFDIADYRGPYVSVWISDEKNRLVKSLALRGTSERWLGELRTWWRRVGRKNEGLVDGFAGATKKNAPLHIEWDGLDDFGQSANSSSLILHIEVAREHGGRSYEKIPFTFDSLTSPITVTGTDEIASITLSLIN